MRLLPWLQTRRPLSTPPCPPSTPLPRPSPSVSPEPSGASSPPNVRAKTWSLSTNTVSLPLSPSSTSALAPRQSGSYFLKNAKFRSVFKRQLMRQFRWFHLFSTWIFAGLYSINTMVVYAIFGDSRDEIYPFLNYGEKFVDAVKFDVMMTFGVQSAVFLFIFSLSSIKFFIHRKCLSKSGAQCRYNYCSCFSSESVSGDQESQQALNNSARDSLGSNRLDGFMNAKEKEAYTNCTYEVSYKSLPQSEL